MDLTVASTGVHHCAGRGPDGFYSGLFVLREHRPRPRCARLPVWQLAGAAYRQLLSHSDLEDIAPLAHRHGSGRRPRLYSCLCDRDDALPPQMAAAPFADHSLLDQLHHPHIKLDSHLRKSGRAQRPLAPSWPHRCAPLDDVHRIHSDRRLHPRVPALYDPQHLCQP